MTDDSDEDLRDDGPLKKGILPLRRCIASGVSKLQNEMVRFVIGPDGDVVPDLKAVLPGRGM